MTRYFSARADLAELHIVTPETLQRVITALANIRGKFKLLPAARDMKAVSARAGLLKKEL
jgi:hypothetical protein